MNVESSAYNDFMKAMLLDDVDYMNEFMNEIVLKSFSNFDVAKNTLCNDKFEITSNRESGFGSYDIVLKPYDREENNVYIIESKVFKSSKEKTLEDTVANTLMQIEEKQYGASLPANGFTPR